MLRGILFFLILFSPIIVIGWKIAISDIFCEKCDMSDKSLKAALIL